jgi:sugar fermentation stimulation protein A
MKRMQLFPNVIQGRFVRRLNRFVVECSLDGEIIQAHLPNPGRLLELLRYFRIDRLGIDLR